jgi:hypothetical protein
MWKHLNKFRMKAWYFIPKKVDEKISNEKKNNYSQKQKMVDSIFT